MAQSSPPHPPIEIWRETTEISIIIDLISVRNPNKMIKNGNNAKNILNKEKKRKDGPVGKWKCQRIL